MSGHIAVGTVFASKFGTVEENEVCAVKTVVGQNASSLNNPETSAIGGDLGPSWNYCWNGITGPACTHLQRVILQHSDAAPMFISLAELRRNEFS